MSDPILSPDGKWMWTGEEWISGPPTEEPLNKETTSSFVDNISGVKVQDSVITSNENLIAIAPVAVARNKSVYVFIVLIIFIGATVGGYLLMNRELEKKEESQDYWSNHNYGFRFTDDDVYVFVNSLEFEQEQECESLINDENWSLIEMDSDLCVFDSILFNATVKEDGYQSLCFASGCVRLDFKGDALYSTSISNDGSTNEHCYLSVRWTGSANFSNSSVAENFSKISSSLREQSVQPAHCNSLLGLDDLHDYIQLFPINSHNPQMSTKVVLISTVIADMTGGSENLFSTFELAPGSSPIYGADIAYAVICDNGGMEGTFSGATIHTGDGATVADPVINLNPGTTYVVDLEIVGCAPVANADNALIISVTGGRNTYESLQYGNSPAVGDVVV